MSSKYKDIGFLNTFHLLAFKILHDTRFKDLVRKSIALPLWRGKNGFNAFTIIRVNSDFPRSALNIPDSCFQIKWHFLVA